MQSYIKKQDKKINQKSFIQLAKTSLSEAGNILREARERKLLSIKDLREKTLIPLHHITSIESGSREKLPEDLFLIGFLKRYAKAVNIDENFISEVYLKNRKLKDPNQETNAFDVLFQEKEEKVLQFGYKKKHIDIKSAENSFIKVYHFYFVVALLLFAVASYLAINFSVKNLNVPKIQDQNLKQKFTETKTPDNENNMETNIVLAKNKNIIVKDIQDLNVMKTYGIEELRENSSKKIIREINVPDETMLRPLRTSN